MVDVYYVNDKLFMIDDKGTLIDANKESIQDDLKRTLQDAIAESNVILLDENAKDPFAEAGLHVPGSVKRDIAKLYFPQEARDRYINDFNFLAVKVCQVNDNYFMIDSGGYLVNPSDDYITGDGLVRSAEDFEPELEPEDYEDSYEPELPSDWVKWDYNETLKRAIEENEVITINESPNKVAFDVANVYMLNSTIKKVVESYFSDKVAEEYLNNYSLSIPRGFVEVCKDIDNYMRNGVTKTCEVRDGVDLQLIDPKYERFIKHIAETEMTKENSMVKNVVDYVLEKSNDIGNNNLPTKQFGSTFFIGNHEKVGLHRFDRIGFGEVSKQYARVFNKGFTSYSREGLAELKKEPKLDYSADVVQFDTSKQPVNRLIPAFYGVCAVASAYNEEGFHLDLKYNQLIKPNYLDNGRTKSSLERVQSAMIISYSLGDLGVTGKSLDLAELSPGYEHNFIVGEDLKNNPGASRPYQKQILDAYADNKFAMLHESFTVTAEQKSVDGIGKYTSMEDRKKYVYNQLAASIEPAFAECAVLADKFLPINYDICKDLKGKNISCEFMEARKDFRKIVADVESKGKIKKGQTIGSPIIDAYCKRCAFTIRNNKYLNNSGLGARNYKFCDFTKVAAKLTLDKNFEPKEVIKELNKFFNDLKKEYGINEKSFAAYNLFDERRYKKAIEKYTARKKINKLLEIAEHKNNKTVPQKYTGR